MSDDQIDPHLRHDFPPPPPRPRHWTTPKASTSGLLWWWLRRLRERLLRWRQRQAYRLVRWFFRRGMLPPLDEILTLRLLVLGLTAVVLAETFLLLISPCVPLLLDSPR
jgi:hypothetical protein